MLSSVVASATESAASVTSSLSSVIESASTTASAESSTAEDASSSPYASTPTSFSSYTGTYSPNPAATGYKNLPPGGVGTDPNGPPPDYSPSDEFDLQSLILATYQEYIELDLFHNGLASYSTGEFDDAGIDESQRYLLQFMAEQEVGHSTAFNNMLPPDSKVQICNYTYPHDSVRSFIDFSQVLTRWGEAGVYGFLPHLTSRPMAQIMLQSITTEAKQQEAFAMMEGLFPQVYWFNMGLPQSYAWSLLVQYISACPPSNPRVNFNVFPLLFVLNQPQLYSDDSQSAVATNNTSLWEPGSSIEFAWEANGVQKGPIETGGYATAVNSSAGAPRFAAFIHQLNVTYVPLEDVDTENRTASAPLPDFRMFNSTNGPNVNGTVFVSLVDEDVYLTPYNLSLIVDHTLAVGYLHAY